MNESVQEERTMIQKNSRYVGEMPKSFLDSNLYYPDAFDNFAFGEFSELAPNRGHKKPK